METATTPKKGKSRFSKALPSPPAFLQKKTLPPSPLPIRKPLPSPQQAFPSRTTSANAAVKPLDSPLPPVPLNAKAAAPPPMTITRRPVAATSTTSPTSSVLPPSSPDDSPLSSLLSAYSDSNRSSDLTQLSSNNDDSHDARPLTGGTPQDSYPGIEDAPEISPKLDELFFAPLSIHPADDDLIRSDGSGIHQGRSGGLLQGKETPKQLPPPPTKESGQVERQTSPAYQPNQISDSTSTSAPQPQIWRRRSLKTEKNIAVTELNLQTSHGSTAPTSSSTESAPGPPPKDAAQLRPDNSIDAINHSPLPPLTPNAGLPGRNIRPVGSRQQLVGESADSMGQEVSRVKNTLKKASGKSDTVRKESQSQSHNALPSFAVHPAKDKAPVQRLPTPEYDSGDLLKSPIVETIVSPVSPASSPDLPSERRQQSVAPSDKPLPSPATGAPGLSSGSSLSNQTGGNFLNQKSSQQGFPSRSPIGLPTSPAANRSGPLPAPNQFPTRTTSKAQTEAAAQPVERVRTLSDTGSIETVKPHVRDFATSFDTKPLTEERREEFTANPGAERFPRSWGKQIPEGTVFRPVPISDRHHRCITKHQVMHQCRNTYYPLACQACGLKDSSWRYTCSSCNLRICKSCRTSLRKAAGDLRALKRHNDTVLVEQSGEVDEEDAKKGGLVASPASTVKATLYS